MAHNVKIEDKLYNKLKAFCDLNDTTVYKLTQEALTEYLNKIQFGDAPFLKVQHGGEYHDEKGKLIITAVSAEDGEAMLTKILSENQDPPFTQELAEKAKEIMKDTIFTPDDVREVNAKMVNGEPIKRPDGEYNNFTEEEINKAAEEVNATHQRRGKRRL